MYNCKIIADSDNTFGNRITTFELIYPRVIHAELMTHRLFSRNAASSRAIPVRKMIESIRNNMFTPLAIQKAHKGMQGSDYFEGVESEQAKQLWIESAELAIQQAEKMEKFGISKQIVNRVVEPYQYYQVLVTATEWKNFFELRCPKYVNEHENGEDISYSRKDFISKLKKRYPTNWESDLRDFHGIENNEDWEWARLSKSGAEIHIQKIAEMMWDCYNESKPKTLQAGEWHIPNLGHEWDAYKIKGLLRSGRYNDENEITPDISELKLKISTAHCAKISYTTLGDNPKIDYEADIKLHDRLLESKHLSCFEHCAMAMTENEYDNMFQKTVPQSNHHNYFVEHIPGWCNNYRGFIQYRYLIENQ